jgi:hypothetical protein
VIGRLEVNRDRMHRVWMGVDPPAATTPVRREFAGLWPEVMNKKGQLQALEAKTG